MKKTIITLGLIVLASATSHGAVSIINTGTAITENFDSLISTGSGTFVDNTTLVGWIVNSEEMDTNSDEYFASDGSANGGETYSYGTGTDVDRALGYLGSSGNDYFNAVISLENNTGSSITDLLVSYTGEQWRSGGNTSDNNNILSFSYQIFSPGGGSVPASTDLTGWTAVNSLDFAAPQTGLASGALDGNAAANQQGFVNVSLGGITLNDGDEIWLRWTGNNGLGTDAGLAIDDVSISAIPEPSSAALLGLGGLALMLRRRK